VKYRDVQHVLPVMIQMLFFVSPVGYAVADVPAKYQPLYTLNPLAGLLEGFRWSLLGGSPLNATQVAYAAAMAVIVGLFGIMTFKKMEREFADVI
jgi:lipopolysaccharide transport system permease protein